MFLKEYNRIEENFLQRIFPDESFAQATKETRQLQLDKITDRGKKTKIPINLGKLFTLEVLQG